MSADDSGATRVNEAGRFLGIGEKIVPDIFNQNVNAEVLGLRHGFFDLRD
jgi:hypothetical protein